ncbi:MAG: hypothetical protein DI536_33815 [Archangium gephyra]|uniref:Restriction endonuclease n=1 Tax=Archangium gephyra TaxID=48 RepID=A0A2W5SSG0_9BACT|nr:MAG: hypothetical protein DI536_33815 [Archangium gephyra]
MLFIVGLLCGAVLGGAAFVLCWRKVPATRDQLSRLLGQASSQALREKVIEEVAKDDSELAAVLAAKPAIPLENAPAEVTGEMQKEISAAPSAEAAFEVAKKFIRDEDVAKVIAELERWRTRRTNSEEAFQRSFKNHATKNGFAGGLEERRRIRWGKDDTRVALPDLILNKRVLVELKAQMDGSGQADRAMGQMLRYLFAWKKQGPAVLAVCGTVSPEFRLVIRMYVKTWREQLHLPVTVFFKQGDTAADLTEALEMPVEPHQFPEA